MLTRALRRSLLAAATFACAAPALAQPGPPPPPPGMPPLGAVDAGGRYYGDPQGMPVPDPRPEWHGDRRMPAQPMGGYEDAGYQQARADWLAECRRNHGNGNMVGGAVVGGVVGGVIGNRVAGRGNRVVGTVVGGALGAVAGGAIGSAADRRSAQDWCESYLDRYTAWQPGAGYGPGNLTYGYAPMTVMVPVAYVQTQGPRECTTTVTTEEYVTEAPRPPHAHRYIPPRPRPVHDKRVWVGDKRVRTN